MPLRTRGGGGVEVQLYSSMIAALEGGEWSTARPDRTLPPGKTWYPFYRRLGGPQGRTGWAENLVSTGNYRYLRKLPEELRSDLHRGGDLKSRKIRICFHT